jgi:acyl-CoA thioester hydrolase
MLTLWEAGQERAWLDSFRVRSNFRPRYCEIDTYGHVSVVMYDAYFEQGRMEYFARVGDPESSRAPFPFPHVIAEQSIRYIASCFFNEDLEVLTKVTELGRSSATVEQAIVDREGAMRAIASTVIVHNDGHENHAWTSAQREAIAGFERFLTSAVREY